MAFDTPEQKEKCIKNLVSVYLPFVSADDLDSIKIASSVIAEICEISLANAERELMKAAGIAAGGDGGKVTKDRG